MTVRIFVNEQVVSADDGCSILSAVASCDETLGDALKNGRAYVTDGVGLELDLSDRVSTGTILRVVVSARRSGSDGSTG